MAAQILSNSGAESMAGHFKGISLVLSPHRGTSVASGRPAPGTLSLTPGTAWSLKYLLQQETHCSQYQGKEDHRLESLCHLTRKSKSHPRTHLCLQGIHAGEEQGTPVISVLLAAARPPGDPP